jgi:hypothetical protein
MERNIFYVYDENKNVKEIRTRLMNHNPPTYIIQKPVQKENKIQYSFEVVHSNKFYDM